jgi:hypothetical protein
MMLRDGPKGATCLRVICSYDLEPYIDLAPRIAFQGGQLRRYDIAWKRMRVLLLPVWKCDGYNSN